MNYETIHNSLKIDIFPKLFVWLKNQIVGDMFVCQTISKVCLHLSQSTETFYSSSAWQWDDEIQFQKNMEFTINLVEIVMLHNIKYRRYRL